jgi:Tol biopolymer transport system component
VVHVLRNVAIVAALAALAGCSALGDDGELASETQAPEKSSSRTETAPEPLEEPWIAAVRSRASTSDIYLIDPTGSDEIQLTRDAGLNTSPAWSPDGSRIAFLSTRDGAAENTFELYVMDADGSGQTRLTREGTGAFAWSPDGTRLAFTRAGPGSLQSDLFVVDSDGSGETRFTEAPGEDHVESWSPDGTKILFSTSRHDEWAGHLETMTAELVIPELYVIDADGGDERRLTTNAFGELGASWSPDGRTILFVGFRAARARVPRSFPRPGSSALYLAGADGSKIRKLTAMSSPTDGAVWSPDGSAIAFTRRHGKNYALIAIDRRGKGLATLFKKRGLGIPTWSPDGTQIAVVAQDKLLGPTTVYVVNTDGSGVFRLKHDRFGELTWSP